jgi:hypothetical protein
MLFKTKMQLIPLIVLGLHLGAFVMASDFSAEKASFSVRFKDETSPYRIIGVFVLPGEKLTIEAVGADKEDQYSVAIPVGKAIEIKEHKWQWTAPLRSDLYPIIVRRVQSSDSIVLNVFVMVPYSEMKGEYLNNYRIGDYPTIPLKQLPIYKPPKGFIEVTEENEEAFVSPHFQLREFLCKQDSDYPKYLVLRERLLLKLELTLEKVNEVGYHCNKFHVMSGYRTPYYNKLIGDVKYSRHIYGGAADIFIDENPKDGMMDDLNEDGVIDLRDAAVLYDIIDSMYGEKWYDRFIGGLGRYKKTSGHGPFVHVDVRGFHARWGY